MDAHGTWEKLVGSDIHVYLTATNNLTEIYTSLTGCHVNFSVCSITYERQTTSDGYKERHRIKIVIKGKV